MQAILINMAPTSMEFGLFTPLQMEEELSRYGESQFDTSQGKLLTMNSLKHCPECMEHVKTTAIELCSVRSQGTKEIDLLNQECQTVVNF